MAGFLGRGSGELETTRADGAAPGDQLPQRREKRVRIRTIRVRDLFG
ncbi:hypothetical protein ABZ471_44505 [Streptomyces sp. NPDC005728]